MKTATALLSLTLTMNVFAASLQDATLVTSILPYGSTAISSTGIPKLQAAIILNDAQEVMQSGQVSTFLAQKIKDAQILDESLSESEALEVVIAEAKAILN
jgi:hypothetical protein